MNVTQQIEQDKQTYQQELEALQKELCNIETGKSILNSREIITQNEISEVMRKLRVVDEKEQEYVRATLIQINSPQEQLATAELQDYIEEQQNIEREKIQEKIAWENEVEWRLAEGLEIELGGI